MSQRSEINKLIKAARKAGCTVEQGGSGHWKIRTPSGELVIAPFSPRTHRGLRDTISRLRKAGVEL